MNLYEKMMLIASDFNEWLEKESEKRNIDKDELQELLRQLLS
jgi:hypothetical protein